MRGLAQPAHEAEDGAVLDHTPVVAVGEDTPARARHPESGHRSGRCPSAVRHLRRHLVLLDLEVRREPVREGVRSGNGVRLANEPPKAFRELMRAARHLAVHGASICRTPARFPDSRPPRDCARRRSCARRRRRSPWRGSRMPSPSASARRRSRCGRTVRHRGDDAVQHLLDVDDVGGCDLAHQQPDRHGLGMGDVRDACEPMRQRPEEQAGRALHRENVDQMLGRSDVVRDGLEETAPNGRASGRGLSQLPCGVSSR